MSGGTACRCEPREVVVTARRCNHSAFNGYRETPSAYSEVLCVRCLASTYESWKPVLRHHYDAHAGTPLTRYPPAP